MFFYCAKNRNASFLDDQNEVLRMRGPSIGVYCPRSNWACSSIKSSLSLASCSDLRCASCPHNWTGHLAAKRALIPSSEISSCLPRQSCPKCRSAQWRRTWSCSTASSRSARNSRGSAKKNSLGVFGTSSLRGFWFTVTSRFSKRSSRRWAGSHRRRAWQSCMFGLRWETSVEPWLPFPRSYGKRLGQLGLLVCGWRWRH